MWVILTVLFIGVLIAGVLYLKDLSDKKLRFKLICPVCNLAYNLDESCVSERKDRGKICSKCRADELNRREIGE